MKKLEPSEAAAQLAKALGKPVLYISFLAEQDYEDTLKAAPYLTWEDHGILLRSCGIIVCEDEEELADMYGRTVGDDGPTELNSYAGPGVVYAVTIGADGEMRNENT